MWITLNFILGFERDMTTLLQFILISCLLQGALCQEWVAFMPQSIDALSGSCVIIPCNFLVGYGWDSYLDSSCKAIWRRGWRRTQVFDSSLTGTDAITNILQGNLTGNLLQKDCTTIFNNVPYHYTDYFFRLECDNNLKFSYGASVNINVKDTLPRPTITPSRMEVEEGTSVRLKCTAAVPCPILPPTLMWTTGLGDIEEEIQGQFLTSNLTFVTSHLHHGQKISCTALYKRPSGNLSLESSLTINILYPPNNTSVSHPGPVQEGSSVTLTCSSNANPAVESYTWHGVDGDQVTPVGFRRILSIKVSEHNSQFYCEARNKYGSQNSSIIQIDVQFAPKDTSVSVSPNASVPEGSTVSLTCSSKANPSVTNYTWYRADRDSKDMVEYGHGHTLTIDGADLNHSGNYYCEARNHHGEDISTPVELDIYYPPKNTSVLVSPSGPVPDGSSVTLSCSSEANPAVDNYTWYRVEEGEEEAIAFEKDLTFNVTKLSREEYYCQAQNIHGADHSEPISIDVKFAPVILASSGCIRILSQKIRCSCDSLGNPPPSLQWELAGESVNGSSNITIKELYLSSTVRRGLITLREVVEEEMPTLVCLSSNTMGFDSFAFNMSSIETQKGVHTTTLLIGSAVGAVGMMLLCVLLEIICRKNTTKKELKKTSEPLAANEAISPDVEPIYANKAMLMVDGADDGDTPYGEGGDGECLHRDQGGDEECFLGDQRGDREGLLGDHGGEQECFQGDQGGDREGLHGGEDGVDTVHGGGDDGECIHYATVDFAAFQARSEGQCEEGEIRGLASKTAEYAELRLDSGGCAGGAEADVEEMPADGALGQGGDMNDERVHAEQQGDGNGVITETIVTELPEL